MTNQRFAALPLRSPTARPGQRSRLLPSAHSRLNPAPRASVLSPVEIREAPRVQSACVALVQFDNLDKAQAWWNSSAQKSAQAIGDKYATFRSYAVEGLSQ
jgi:hypothetical protein